MERQIAWIANVAANCCVLCACACAENFTGFCHDFVLRPGEQ